MTAKRVERKYLGICLDCSGTGRLAGEQCEHCRGRGAVEKIRTEIVDEDEIKQNNQDYQTKHKGK